MQDEIRTNPRKGRNSELICHNCGRLGDTHMPFHPYNCKSYETEEILQTTFEAYITYAGKHSF